MTPRKNQTQSVGDIDKDIAYRAWCSNEILKATPWRSVYVAALCSFAQSLQYGLFFSSLWPYLKRLDSSASETCFGYIVVVYSLSQCVSSPIFGYWSNRAKQVRSPTLFCLSMMLLSNLIYTVLEMLPTGYVYAMAVTRTLIGIGSSNVVLLRAYASTASTSADRSRAIGCVATAISIGLVVGPGLQTLFTPLGEDGVHVLPGWPLNMYTAPAFLAGIANICGILLMYFVFNEQYAGIKEDCEETTLPPADLIAVAICVASRFAQLSVMTNLEALGSAYSMLMFDLSTSASVRVNSISLAVQGIGAVFILLPFIFFDVGKRLKQRAVNIACIVGFLAFHLVTYPWDDGKSYVTVHKGESHAGGCDANRFSWCSTMPRVNMWVYYIALCVLFEVTFAVHNVVLPTIFSKVIGPRRQGLMQGIFQTSGSLARMTEAVILSGIYDRWGPRGVWQLEIAQLSLILLLWLIFRRRLVPLELSSCAAAAYAKKKRDMNWECH